MLNEKHLNLRKHYRIYINKDQNKSFSARELCIEKCTSVLSECLIECRGDISCTSGCNRQYAQCESTCPCGGLCFDGCPCSHFVKGFIQPITWVQILGSTSTKLESLQSLKTNRRFLDPVCKNVFESIIVCKTYLQKPVSLQSVPKKCLITRSLVFRLLASIQRPRQLLSKIFIY